MKTFFEKTNLKYGVIGSGSWATALVKVLCSSQGDISWYVRDVSLIEYIKKHHHNRDYVSSIYLHPEKLNMSDDINEVIEACDVLLFVIPSTYFMVEIENVKASLHNKFILSAIKGFVSHNNMTVAEYFHHYHNIPFDRIGVIGGPTHAEEISLERLSYLTLASKHIEISRALCDLFRGENIKTRTSTDIYGVEYAAAMKNIYAILAGICHGLGYGDNFMAVLVSSAYHEMMDFINTTHPDKKRVPSKSVYLGDLLVTSYSQFSRNRTFGGMIGKGYSVISAQVEMGNMVTEGYYAARCIHNINLKYKVDIPLAESVYRILYENKYPAYIIAQLTEDLG